MKKILLSIFIFIAAFNLAEAQSPAFSQFFANRLYLNPAFAGSEDCPHIAVNYRNQFPSLQQAFVTYSVSYDQYVDFLHGGVGLHILRDSEGDGLLSSTYFDAIYSYHVNVTRKLAVKLGIQASYISRALDWNRLIFPDMITGGGTHTPTAEEVYESPENMLDFSAGLLVHSKQLYLGVSVQHLAYAGFSKNVEPFPNKYTFHVGANIKLAKDRFSKTSSQLSPNIVYIKQLDYQQINYGFYLTINNITGGAWLRQDLTMNMDAAVFLIGFQFRGVRLAYSYDLNISKKTAQNLSSHEVSLALQLNCWEKRKKRGVISCPKF